MPMATAQKMRRFLIAMSDLAAGIEDLSRPINCANFTRAGRCNDRNYTAPAYLLSVKSASIQRDKSGASKENARCEPGALAWVPLRRPCLRCGLRKHIHEATMPARCR